MIARGIRNNNPLNIRRSKDNWPVSLKQCRMVGVQPLSC